MVGDPGEVGGETPVCIPLLKSGCQEGNERKDRAWRGQEKGKEGRWPLSQPHQVGLLRQTPELKGTEAGGGTCRQKWEKGLVAPPFLGQ